MTAPRLPYLLVLVLLILMTASCGVATVVPQATVTARDDLHQVRQVVSGFNRAFLAGNSAEARAYLAPSLRRRIAHEPLIKAIGLPFMPKHFSYGIVWQDEHGREIACNPPMVLVNVQYGRDGTGTWTPFTIRQINGQWRITALRPKTWDLQAKPSPPCA